MKFITVITALMAFAILAVAPIRAADSTTDTPSESSKHMNYHGTIMAIDMSANTVTIKTDEGTMTMSFNAGTRFRGGTKSLSDLKVGDAISGTYMMGDSGKMMAISVKPYRSKS
jgi:Cu/Ag efflux protein CusF